MEPGTDLKTARNAWLEALKSRESISPGQLRELEVHLDDAMDDLTARGLSADEAFLIGTRRIGSPEPLAAEFRKVGTDAVFAARARWMLLGVVAYLVSLAVAQIIHDLGGLATAFLPQGWIRATWPLVIFTAGSFCGVWFLRSCLRGELKWLPGWALRNRLRAVSVLLLGVLALPVVVRTLTTMIAIQVMGVAEYGSHTVMWRWVNLASILVWLAALALLLRRYWQPVPPVAAK